MLKSKYSRFMENLNKKYLAKEEPLTETVFGVQLQDNYRYFEDRENKEALAWMKKQTHIADEFVDKNNLTTKIYNEFIALDDYQDYTYAKIISCKFFIYYTKRHYNELTAKLYKTNLKTKEETLLIDFDKFEKELDFKIQMLTYTISPNEKFLSFAIGISGKEVGNVHFYNLVENKIEKYIVENNRFSATWVNDDSFFYFIFPNIENEDSTAFDDMELVFHDFNSKEKDVILFSEKNTKVLDEIGSTFNFYIPKYDTESKTLFVSHIKSTDGICSLYSSSFEPNKPQNFNFSKIFSFKDEIKEFDIFGDNIYFATLLSGEMQINYCKLNDFSVENATLIEIPNDEFLQMTYKLENDLCFVTLKNSYNKLYRLNTKTNKYVNITTESKGKIFLNDTKNKPLIFSSSNFKTPNIHYSVDENNKVQKHEIVNSKLKIDLSDIEMITEEFESYDGEKVPITYAFKKGIVLNSKNKCLINAYGSYGISMYSYFSTPFYRWMNNGGIVAFAHVRGGGEKGEKWHVAGQKELKHNSWKDLIEAGEYLISKKYTSTEYLACQGTSAGGITVGMTANERPDLFGAIISNVGSNSVIRRGRNPGGGYGEFGNSSIEKEFSNLLKMDVYQNVKEQGYPNILFTAGKEDGRVDYWQPAKACAKMQKMTTSNDRIFLMLFENFGHGNYGASRKDSLNYMAKQYAFLESVLK